jgi:hypothetical protein
MTAKLKHEMALFTGRTDPVCREFFDGYLTLGLRAGGGPMMTVACIPSPEIEARMENEVLALAAGIIKRRNGAN